MSGPRSFFHWVLQVLLLAGLLVFFLWLSLRPSEPAYTIINFNAANVTTGNDTTISFGINISNDNKVGGVCYFYINITLYVRDNSFGTTSMSDSCQGHGKVTSKVAAVRASRRLLAPALKGTADLKVELAAAVKYEIWWWRSKVHWMDMEASVPVGVDGKVRGMMKEIKMQHRADKKLRLQCRKELD